MKITKYLIGSIVVLLIIGIILKGYKSYTQLDEALKVKQRTDWAKIDQLPIILEPVLRVSNESYLQSTYLMGRLGLIERQREIFHQVDKAFYSYIASNFIDGNRLKESYINLVYLGKCKGSAIEGITAGAKCYFEKSVDELTLSQLVSLVVLSEAPAYLIKNIDELSKRKVNLLKALKEKKIISKQEYNTASAEKNSLQSFVTGEE